MRSHRFATRFTAVVALAMTLIMGGSTAQATPAAGLGQRPDLEAALNKVVEAGSVSAMAEVRDGASVWRGSAGTTQLNGHRPAPVDGRYRAGSITKTLVATVVLQLAGEKRLSLSDSVERWLPGLVPNGSDITVRQLLQHTSGLYDYTDELLPHDSSILKLRSRTFRPVELVRIAVEHEPGFPPGTKQKYSNTDYILLGMIIEKATGRSYGQQIERRILRPLRMSHSSMPGTFPFLIGPHAHVYVPLDKSKHAPPVDVTVMNPSIAGAAGELISTTADLNRFYRALVNGQLLSPAQLADMTDPRGMGSGLGLEIADLPCGRALGHGGGGPGFLGLSFITADGARQITLTMAPWGGNPQPAAMAMLATVLCPP